MEDYNATEQAYKNGYEQAVKDLSSFVNSIIKDFSQLSNKMSEYKQKVNYFKYFI